MNQTTLDKLARLKHRRTRYELIATDGTQTLHAGYCGKGASNMLNMIRMHHEAWTALAGTNTYTSVSCRELRLGRWTIRHSGRTQREAIIAGELPWFKTALSQPAAS